MGDSTLECAQTNARLNAAAAFENVPDGSSSSSTPSPSAAKGALRADRVTCN